MKKLLLFLSICLIIGRLCASGNKSAVARIFSCPHLRGIVDMKVLLGQYVKKGQLLFKISTDYMQIGRAKCENSLWYYKEEYKRVKKLSKTHSKSVENLQEARRNLEHSIGSLKIRDLLINKWSQYYAPFDGIVTKINNYSGSGVASSSGNYNINNAILEVTKLEDYRKEEFKIGSPLAQVVTMLEGIVELKVSLGEKVKKDQLLFNINTAFYEIRKATQKANVEYNKARFERTKQLYEQNNGSLKHYQTAVYDYKNAVLKLKSIELLINRRSSYHSPFDGRVTDIIHYTGSYVFVGHKVLEVTKI
jgi:hypothetical protein